MFDILQNGDDHMKAVVCRAYGGPNVLHVRDVRKPVPKDDQVLVKVHAASVTAADSMMRRADPFISRFFLGFWGPKTPITGTGFAGEVVAVGREVLQFKIGDRVFGETGLGFSAHAEYLCIDETGVITHLPDAISYAHAAPICDGAMTSLNFLREIAGIKPGQKILVIGASGGLGTSAVQLAAHFGADVTGVCSTSNLDLVRSLGAHHVVDYRQEDFAKNGEVYDVIYDTIGVSSYGACRRSLTENGVYMSPVLGGRLLLNMAWTCLWRGRSAKFAATGLSPEPVLRKFLQELVGLFDAGRLRTVMDRSYSISQISNAHTYVDAGHKKGNVVLKIAA